MRALRGWLVAVLVVAAGAVGLVMYSRRKDPVPVRVTVIGRGKVEESVTSTKAGSVRSRRAADLGADAAGIVTALKVREGAAVSAGDLLLSVDHREPEAALAAAEKELSATEALLDEAKARQKDAVRERARLEGLRQSQGVSQAELDAASTAVSVAEATVAAASARIEARKADVERAKVVVKKCDLFAPFAGVISERLVEEGEWVSPGRVVLRLFDPGRLYVRAEVDEVDIAELKPGLKVRVELDPWKGRRLTGVVTRVAPVVSEAEEENRTVEVEAEITGGGGGLELKPGTSADVEVILREAEGRLRVPTQALVEGTRVLVAGADGKAKAVDLKVGLRNWEFTEVVEGLKEGDRVIVSLESEELKDGVEIRVTAEEK